MLFGIVSIKHHYKYINKKQNISISSKVDNKAHDKNKACKTVFSGLSEYCNLQWQQAGKSPPQCRGAEAVVELRYT